VPVGLNLLAPGSVRGLLATPLLSLRGKLRAALECCVPQSPARGDESLASFVRRRFGSEFLERIAQPVVGGIYTADPEKLSLAATLPRFLEMERKNGSLIRGARRHRRRQPASDNASGARYGLFASLTDGMSELQDALAARVRAAARIEVNQCILSLSTGPATTSDTQQNQESEVENQESFQLQLSAGSTGHFDAVIVALPAHAAAAVLSNAFPELSRALGEIEYASSAIVVTGHRLADVSHPLDAAGLVVPHVEARQILAVSFLSRKFPTRAPAGHVILRTFVGGAMQPQLLERSDDALISLVRAELADILGVRSQPAFAVVVRYPRGMPQYHVGHLERVANIERLAAQVPGLALAGNTLHGVGLPDCIHSGEAAVERVWAELACAPKSMPP
jgi:oxygen-dependent protoporphyrinogen oxidase